MLKVLIQIWSFFLVTFTIQKVKSFLLSADLMLLSRNRVTFSCTFPFGGHSISILSLQPTDGRFYPVLLHLFQAKKVNFTVHAIVTTSDLEISPAQINFGYCTIYEAVQANVILTNKSILPQEFGFVGLPEVRTYPTHTPSAVKIDFSVMGTCSSVSVNKSWLALAAHGNPAPVEAPRLVLSWSVWISLGDTLCICQAVQTPGRRFSCSSPFPIRIPGFLHQEIS